jgi:hypothetical protein
METGYLDKKSQENEISKSDSTLIRCTLSKITFPEACPVCLKEPEDLVSITVLERPLGERGDDRTYSTLIRRTSKTNLALEAARAAVTLWVPTCLRHGSGSIRSDRMRLTAMIAFFVLFYPILYFFLAVRSSSSFENILGLAVSGGLFIIILLYSLFPRALERHLKIIELEQPKDRVYLTAINPNYLKQFMRLNEMHCDIVESIDVDSK